MGPLQRSIEYRVEYTGLGSGVAHFDNPPISDRAQAQFVKSKDLTLRLNLSRMKTLFFY